MIPKSTSTDVSSVRSLWLAGLAEGAVPEVLPVLARTRRTLGTLFADQRASLRKLALALMADPGMALRALQKANAVPHRHFRAEVVTLEDAAHMLGTQALLRMESEASMAEQTLDRSRLSPYRRSAGRGVLAALLAYDWAEMDRDRIPSEVSVAALLNNLGELYLLAHGDARIKRYLDLVDRLYVLPHEAEYVSLSESLEEFGYMLAVQWGLPEMVREAMRARNALRVRTLCVMLATQTARYAFSGWKHPSQSTDLRMAAEMLDLALPALVMRINRVLNDFNRIAMDFGLGPLTLLPLDVDVQRLGRMASEQDASFCLAPRRDDFETAMSLLGGGQLADREAVLVALLRGLHRGLGLNRVVFANYSARQGTLSAEFLVGTDFEPAFNRFSLGVEDSGLFGRLLHESSAIWCRDENRAEFLPHVPPAILELTGVDSFFVASLVIAGRPLGLVYADRRSASCHLDSGSFHRFLELIRLARRDLERLSV